MIRFLLSVLVALLLFPTNGFASSKSEDKVDPYQGHLRIRLREHYDFLFVHYGSTGVNASYGGLSNTINVWYEKPQHFSVGLAFNPILGGATVLGPTPVNTNSTIKLWTLGAELKYYFYPLKRGVFGRLGVTGNILDPQAGSDPNGLPAVGGAGYYLGFGWEYLIGSVGINPEIAFRHVLFDDNSRVLSFTFSIGIHFYMLSKEFLRMDL